MSEWRQLPSWISSKQVYRFHNTVLPSSLQIDQTATWLKNSVLLQPSSKNWSNFWRRFGADTQIKLNYRLQTLNRIVTSRNLCWCNSRCAVQPTHFVWAKTRKTWTRNTTCGPKLDKGMEHRLIRQSTNHLEKPSFGQSQAMAPAE